MDLKDTQIKDTYGNLLTIGDTPGTPTTGTLQNGDGSDVTQLTLAGGAVINEGGGNNDFRVEGDTDQNLLFVDASANKVGIGTNTPTAPLSFGKSVYGATSSENFYRIKFTDVGGIVNDTGIGQTESGALGFNCEQDKEIEFFAGTRGKLASFVSLGGVRYLRMASGTDGIQFGGDASSANALNDYEEGTWTPVFEPQTGSFTTMTMDIISSVYTKIGRQVTVSAWIRTDNVDATGASGDLRISGLPFTASGTGFSAISIGSVGNWSTAPTNGYVDQARIILTKSGGDTFSSVSDLTTGASANKNTIILTATYFV